MMEAQCPVLPRRAHTQPNSSVLLKNLLIWSDSDSRVQLKNINQQTTPQNVKWIESELLINRKKRNQIVIINLLRCPSFPLHLLLPLFVYPRFIGITVFVQFVFVQCLEQLRRVEMLRIVSVEILEKLIQLIRVQFTSPSEFGAQRLYPQRRNR